MRASGFHTRCGATPGFARRHTPRHSGQPRMTPVGKPQEPAVSCSNTAAQQLDNTQCNTAASQHRMTCGAPWCNAVAQNGWSNMPQSVATECVTTAQWCPMWCWLIQPKPLGKYYRHPISKAKGRYIFQPCGCAGTGRPPLMCTHSSFESSYIVTEVCETHGAHTLLLRATLGMLPYSPDILASCRPFHARLVHLEEALQLPWGKWVWTSAAVAMRHPGVDKPCLLG
eukprot:89950-Chlamydomonas_euryale.AAC.4